jgi:hypothetical protein
MDEHARLLPAPQVFTDLPHDIMLPDEVHEAACELLVIPPWRALREKSADAGGIVRNASHWTQAFIMSQVESQERGGSTAEAET